MKFSQLLYDAELACGGFSGDAEVANVLCDSKRCGPGSCFVAVRGWTNDGHKYIRSAVENGCSAVVCQDVAAIPSGISCPVTVVDDSHAALGRLAQAIRGWPARKLTVIGVTGTNGKSTTTHLIRTMLDNAGCKSGLLGTIAYETGRRSIPASNTTPDPVVLAEVLAEMVSEGLTHVVMEVSSHALHQRRVEGLKFRTAVFTNLTGDHLDYHKTMEEYTSAKKMLFAGLDADATAVINRDDATGQAMADAANCRKLWYGLNQLADIQAVITRIDAVGTVFDIHAEGCSHEIVTPLIGRHNVYNSLAAVGACRSLGMDWDAMANSLRLISNVPGRLERVGGKSQFGVFVDYAHTDDALDNVLKSLRAIAGKGKIILVFGCGGDRDRTKRPRMAKIAEKFADRIVITSDNPRTEDPLAIIEEIKAGLSADGMSRTDVQPDRSAAIRRAIELADQGDLVLIAGKGHEKYQIIGDKRNHFDDVEFARSVVDALEIAG